MKLRNLFYLLLLVSAGFTACSTDEGHPGYDYFPDMVYSRAYEAYSNNPNFDDSTQALMPVPGTIPRGYEPFHYQNMIEDYERAGTELKNPIPNTLENIAEGQYYYSIYCQVCHGPGGEGDGSIVQREKFPPPPSFLMEPLISLSDGKMFFSVHYGKGLMGSYASQLTKEERWKVILYVNSIQDKATATAGADTVKTTSEGAGQSTSGIQNANAVPPTEIQ